MEATEQYFHVVQFIKLQKVFLHVTFNLWIKSLCVTILIQPIK